MEELKEVLETPAAETEASAAEAPTADAVAEEVTETMADYSRELEASFRKIAEGDIISGTVIDVSEEGVILDLRYYAQGVIKAEDMSDAPDFAILRDVKVGDTLEATVVRMMTDRATFSFPESLLMISWHGINCRVIWMSRLF